MNLSQLMAFAVGCFNNLWKRASLSNDHLMTSLGYTKRKAKFIQMNINSVHAQCSLEANAHASVQSLDRSLVAGPKMTFLFLG